jgi:hypothetical protein
MSKLHHEQGDDLIESTTTALQADAIFIKAALLWISHHPELSPLFYTIGKYAAHHAMTSCFSEGVCKNCYRGFHLMGMDVDHVGPMDLCQSVLISAYAEAMRHPFDSLKLATKGVEVIQEGISTLASMPASTSLIHNSFAAYLGNNSVKTMQDVLENGQKFYKSNTAWLYVGLPEVLSKIKSSGTKDQNDILSIIHDVYEKWRIWGVNAVRKDIVKNAQVVMAKT